MRRPIRFDSEAVVHEQICTYLKVRYPGVIFRSDFAAGLKLPPAVAVRHAKHQSSRAFPDLTIYENSHVLYGDYPLLAIEIKKAGVKIYRQDGELVADPHIREQAAMLERLRERGYKAEFGIGFEACRDLIDAYLTGGKPTFF